MPTTSTSDFVDVSSDCRRSMGLTAGAIALLGFGEACLRCRRPVPLGLACRFAVFNLVPSFVWKSIDMSVIFKSAKVSLAEAVDASVLSETLRSFRYIVASSSVLYHFVHLRDSRASSEKVVRLTTSTSRLTPHSVQAHGDHFAIVEIERATPNVTQLDMQQWCLHQLDATRSDVFLVEADLSSVTCAAQATAILEKVRHVIAPFRGPRAFMRRMEAVVVLLASPSTAPEMLVDRDWDISVNSASIVSTHLLDMLEASCSRTSNPSPDDADNDAIEKPALDHPVIIHTESMDQYQALAHGLLQAQRIPLRYREGDRASTDPAAVHVIAFQKASSAVERMHVLMDLGALVPNNWTCLTTG
ncbi:hypothetical protein, variant 4 [Aphanomyces invadans]|uniref:Uncharacterized protein n=1 Tax=Aphanomyces invadans TaxID=157072 RepID=A0A024UMJ2_9STRA|nr:hypothetical protein, variant 4 [Aphanomyces invadans]ETW06833.1 hypothetical protein, variant 4 [Aphanomyces invadans]|eukprot:XP_008864908.1 hypothetical protein, variant 4 [Aphanomyces invadans]